MGNSMVVMLATCSSPKNSINQNEETLRKFLISNGFERLIPDKSRTNFWRDTIRLDKYNLTIYTHDMTGLDGFEYRFFVEDSLNDVFVLHRSGWFPPLTDYYPRKLTYQ